MKKSNAISVSWNILLLSSTLPITYYNDARFVEMLHPMRSYVPFESSSFSERVAKKMHNAPQCSTVLHTPHIDCRVKRFVNSKKAILTTEPMRMIIDRNEVHAVVE
jgi:hypothetical protein